MPEKYKHIKIISIGPTADASILLMHEAVECTEQLNRSLTAIRIFICIQVQNTEYVTILCLL